MVWVVVVIGCGHWGKGDGGWIGVIRRVLVDGSRTVGCSLALLKVGGREKEEGIDREGG